MDHHRKRVTFEDVLEEPLHCRHKKETEKTEAEIPSSDAPDNVFAPRVVADLNCQASRQVNEDLTTLSHYWPSCTPSSGDTPTPLSIPPELLLHTEVTSHYAACTVPGGSLSSSSVDQCGQGSGPHYCPGPVDGQGQASTLLETGLIGDSRDLVSDEDSARAPPPADPFHPSSSAAEKVADDEGRPDLPLHSPVVVADPFTAAPLSSVGLRTGLPQSSSVVGMETASPDGLDAVLPHVGGVMRRLEFDPQTDTPDAVTDVTSAATRMAPLEECPLCSQMRITAFPVRLPMTRVGDVAVHVTCALWTPEVYYNEQMGLRCKSVDVD